MSNSEPFSHLIARFRDGDPMAGETICRKLWPMMLMVIARQLRQQHRGDSIRASDVCQIAFQRLWEHRAELRADDRHGVMGYLHRTSLNAINRLIRQHNCRREITESDLRHWRQFAAPARSVAERELREDALARVRDHVSPRRWWLLKARAAGRSWGEIGAELGCAANAARMAHQRLVVQLRLKLLECDH